MGWFLFIVFRLIEHAYKALCMNCCLCVRILVNQLIILSSLFHCISTLGKLGWILSRDIAKMM